MTVTQVIKSILSRVIDSFGYLNGKFHLMCIIYYFYYGFMLQPFQTVLGWKDIFGTKVTKSF